MSTLPLSPTGTSGMHSIKPRRKWLRYALITAAIMALLVVGILAAYIPYASDNTALKAALTHVESGAIPDESPEYADKVAAELRVQPPAKVAPGSYSNITTFGDVTYNAVLALKDDGTYDSLLTVGNPRVFKLYKQTGKWRVEGRVLLTVMLEGDQFLTAPKARDHKTPSRELILDASPDRLVLQAHYGNPVPFDKVK